MNKALVALVLAVATVWSGQAWAQRQIKVGVVQDGKSEAYDRLSAAIREAVEEMNSDDSAFEFSAERTKTCDFTVTCVNQALDAMLADPDVGVVVTEGVLGSNLVVQREQLAKPVLAPLVIDLKLLGLPKRVARKNLSYVVWAPDWERDLKQFRRVAKFEKLGVVVDKVTLDAFPSFGKEVEAAFKAAGTQAVVIPMGDTAKSVLDALPKDVDAIYVGSLFRMPEAELKLLAEGFKARRLPSFSFAGQYGVELGFLAGVGSPNDLKEHARRTALNLRGLVKGDPPETLLTSFKQSEKLILNAPVARAIGVMPDTHVLLDVEIVGGRQAPGGDGSLTLAEAVRQALKTNLDLAASREGLQANAEQVYRARSGLLPQLDVGIGGRWIDKDRTLLYGAERSISWSAQLQQTIYDERNWGSFTSEKHTQRAREKDQRAFELDVALSTALAYLELLRTQTAVEVRKEDLGLSRSNLELARVREKVGVGGREEVFRWESQLANNQNQLVSTVALEHSAKVQLNTLLNRPSERSIAPKEISIDDPSLLSHEKKLRQYFENPGLFAVLANFMTQESQRLAPELGSLDASLAAAERNVTAQKRSYLVPTVVASAGIEHRFYEAGAGSDPVPLPGGETPDNVDWQVGVVAKLPILEGGGHSAQLTQAERQRGQLTLQKKAVAREIERRLRVSLYQANAALASIDLTATAAKAAASNLEVVTDKYREGTAPIIQLLDAQNQSVVAQLDAANAVFDFLAQLMRVERAMGRFNFLVDKSQTADFFRRLDDFARRTAQRPSESP